MTTMKSILVSIPTHNNVLFIINALQFCLLLLYTIELNQWILILCQDFYRSSAGNTFLKVISVISFICAVIIVVWTVILLHLE